MRRPTLLAAAVLMSTLTACSAGSGGSSGSGSPASATPTAGTSFDLALPPAVRSMTFTDEHGKRLTLASLAGTDLVIADVMTDCQEVCPMTSVNMRDAAAAAASAGLDASRVRFLEITIDPRRDTVRRLAAYQRLFGARSNWDFLTAAPADIARFWRTVGVAVTRAPAATPAPKDWLTGRPLTYDLQHQDVVLVVDGRGHERWLEQGTPATRGAQPPTVLKRFLSDQGRKNLAAPRGLTWTVADVDGALTWLTGSRVG